MAWFTVGVQDLGFRVSGFALTYKHLMALVKEHPIIEPYGTRRGLPIIEPNIRVWIHLRFRAVSALAVLQ